VIWAGMRMGIIYKAFELPLSVENLLIGFFFFFFFHLYVCIYIYIYILRMFIARTKITTSWSDTF